MSLHAHACLRSASAYVRGVTVSDVEPVCVCAVEHACTGVQSVLLPADRLDSSFVRRLKILQPNTMSQRPDKVRVTIF